MLPIKQTSTKICTLKRLYLSCVKFISLSDPYNHPRSSSITSATIVNLALVYESLSFLIAHQFPPHIVKKISTAKIGSFFASSKLEAYCVSEMSMWIEISTMIEYSSAHQFLISVNDIFLKPFQK